MDNEAEVREAIAINKNRIEQERAFTVDRVDRLRRFSDPDQFEKRMREEWRHFHDRTYHLERENESMIKALADLQSLRAPPPMILPVTDEQSDKAT